MSTVVLDTITGKSTATTITIGSTPVVSASANSMTIRGEGSAQTSIQQGLAKAWVQFNGSGTIAARDSFNHASLTDNGTGDYTSTATNAMSNDDYAGTLTGDVEGVSDFCIACTGDNATARTTTVIRVRIGDTGGLPQDSVTISASIHGDLA